MKKIPETFKKYGYDFKLLKRLGGIALYEQSSKGVVYAYEVHKVRKMAMLYSKFTNAAGKIKVVNFPAMEKLASSSEFGMFGWSFQKKENAEIKFKELVHND